jgi:hypothetical protein
MRREGLGRRGCPVKRLFFVALTVSLALLPAAASARSARAGDHGGSRSSGNRGGNGNHYGWDKQSPSGTQQAPGAHDRSIESGGSYPQGYSTSDPDGMTNGGADKPGGTGGLDKTDQDGNNGCGNDTDFEDDNNGLCGGQHEPKDDLVVGSAVVQPIGAVNTSSPITSFGMAEPLPRTSVDAAVLHVVPPAPVEAAPVDAPSTSVLSEAANAAAHFVSATSDVAGGAGSSLRGILPLTGMEIAMLALMGLVLIAGGAALRAVRRAAVA